MRLHGLADCYRGLSQYAKSIGIFEEAMEQAKKAGDRKGEGVYLEHMGQCKSALGDYVLAIACHKEHFDIANELGSSGAQAFALLGLGVVLLQQTVVERRDAVVDVQNLSDATLHLDTTIRLAHTHGWDYTVNYALLHLAFLLFHLGQEETVVRSLQQTL